MALRSPAANLREQAVELLAVGDEPPAVAQAIGITEEELRGWRKRRTFNDAVRKRTRELLDEREVRVLFRVASQAEQGQSAQQKTFLDYQQKRRELEIQKSSDRWLVAWSSPASRPVTPDAPEASEEPKPDEVPRE